MRASSNTIRLGLCAVHLPPARGGGSSCWHGDLDGGGSEQRTGPSAPQTGTWQPLSIELWRLKVGKRSVLNQAT